MAVTVKIIIDIELLEIEKRFGKLADVRYCDPSG
jgi:hypothetical protein